MACETKSDTFISPSEPKTNIIQIREGKRLDSECFARLSKIEAIFKCYSKREEISCLKFIPNLSGISVAERIDEIIEDAYFLEASHLRKIFGVEQNKLAIKKKLSKLLASLAKTAKWGKNLISPDSVQIFGGDYVDKSIDLLNEIIPSFNTGSRYQPILINQPMVLIKRKYCS